MGVHSLNKEKPEDIRMVLQRLCENDDVVELGFGKFKGDFKVLGEAPDRIILGISDVERGQWGLKSGSRLTLRLLDRGLPFEAVVDFQGHGKYHGEEACHVAMPRLLRVLDTHRLADFMPDRPLSCSFSDQQNDVMDGSATAFGEEGLELAPPEGTRILGDVLRLNAHSTVELKMKSAANLVLPVKVAYFGESVWGMRILDSVDSLALAGYRQWLLEARHSRDQKDQARFSPRGMESPRLSAAKETPKTASAEPRLLVDHDPLLLVLAEGEAFPARLAEAIGRKFGVAALDLGPGPLRPALGNLGVDEQDWGRIRLVLIHHHLRTGSALERCRRLAQDERCPLPILLAGTEEDADLKRNRAMAAGAVDYMVVEPFKILSVIRILDETLRLFS